VIYFISKEPYILTKEPYILTKKPYMDAFIGVKSTDSIKSDLYPIKRALHTHKKNYTLTKEPYVLSN